LGRVINTNNPGKRRDAAMRTIAEILRRLGQTGGEINDDVRDMVAMIVLSLREVDETIVETIEAWEKRGYWQKADKFQTEWMWAEAAANRLKKILKEDNWAALPEAMLKMLPKVAHIEINKMMRDPQEWDGAYERLMADLNKQ
jgi:hypothetical protein